MQLKNVTLSNFRCFKHLELKLHPRITVLVAENGGGKTAILDGIAIGLASVRGCLSSANQRLSGQPGFKDTDFRLEAVGENDRFKTSDVTQIEIEARNGLKWDKWKGAGKGKKPNRIIGKKELSDYGINILDSLHSQTPELFPVFAYYGAKQRGWLSMPDRLHSKKIDYSQPASALLGSLESSSDFANMLTWFDVEEANELRINKGGKPEDFEESESLAAVRGAIEILLGGDYTNPHFNRQNQFVVDAKIGPQQIPVSQLSQGYQAMLALGMDFARRMAIANPHLNYNNILDQSVIVDLIIQGLLGDDIVEPALMAPAIMLVDEIDLHLHPSWQQRVLADLMRAFPCTQFIVTTHSPQILTTLRKENIRILDQDADGNWRAEEPSFSPLAHRPGDALAEIMDTPPRPELKKVTGDIHAYEQLAKAGNSDSVEAIEIKDRLDKAGFEFNDADTALFHYLAQKAEQKGAGKK